MTEELKPCPFCGSTDLVVRELYAGEYPSPVVVKCYNCGACGPTGDYESPAERAWNSRAADALESRLPSEG